jgi:DNA-binding NarL/FixJ family response regulator
LKDEVPCRIQLDKIERMPDQKLSVREREILKAIAKGQTTSEIAEAFFIEVTTVETHRRKMLQKFGAKKVAELVKKASKVYWLE